MIYDALNIKQCYDNGDTRGLRTKTCIGRKVKYFESFLTRHSWVHKVELLVDASECSNQTFSDVKLHDDFKYDVG